MLLCPSIHTTPQLGNAHPSKLSTLSLIGIMLPRLSKQSRRPTPHPRFSQSDWVKRQSDSEVKSSKFAKVPVVDKYISRTRMQPIKTKTTSNNIKINKIGVPFIAVIIFIRPIYFNVCVYGCVCVRVYGVCMCMVCVCVCEWGCVWVCEYRCVYQWCVYEAACV